eukprot:jgi/Tetstr1/442408/TSEL_030533.t1
MGVAREEVCVSKADFLQVVKQLQLQGIKVELPDGLQSAVSTPDEALQERDSVDSAAQNHLEHEVAELQRGLAEVDTRLKQMGKALVELARVGQETVERGPAARQVDQTALRDWVAQELTKLRGQGKATHAACLENTRQLDSAREAVLHLQHQLVDEQEEALRQQDAAMERVERQGQRMMEDMEQTVRRSVHEALQQDSKLEHRMQALARGQEHLKDDINRLRAEVRVPGMLTNGKAASVAQRHSVPGGQPGGIIWTSAGALTTAQPVAYPLPGAKSKMNAGQRIKPKAASSKDITSKQDGDEWRSFDANSPSPKDLKRFLSNQGVPLESPRSSAPGVLAPPGQEPKTGFSLPQLAGVVGHTARK